jgi:hypothetical protein
MIFFPCSMNSGIWRLQKNIQGSLCRIFKSQTYNDGFACICNGSEEDVRDNFDRSTSFNWILPVNERLYKRMWGASMVATVSFGRQRTPKNYSNLMIDVKSPLKLWSEVWID